MRASVSRGYRQRVRQGLHGVHVSLRLFLQGRRGGVPHGASPREIIHRLLNAEASRMDPKGDAERYVAAAAVPHTPLHT